MKTSPAPKLIKLSSVIALGIAIALAQPVFGSVIHQLVITENSSSNLTVTFDGQPPVALSSGTDFWIATFSHPIHVPGTVWLEAGGTLWNTLSFDATNTVMTISSDVKPVSPFPLPKVKNGTTVHGGTY